MRTGFFPPEPIGEVAASAASIKLRNKWRAYCRNGVREYLVWLVAEARLEWFCFEDAPLFTGDTAKVLVALKGHEPLARKSPETSVKSEDPFSFDPFLLFLFRCNETPRPISKPTTTNPNAI
jgi:hypothetical protein